MSAGARADGEGQAQSGQTEPQGGTGATAWGAAPAPVAISFRNCEWCWGLSGRGGTAAC